LSSLKGLEATALPGWEEAVATDTSLNLCKGERPRARRL
jgi:hypothetical protein